MRQRSSTHVCATLSGGRGDTRFAPLDDTAHTYLATTAFAALLESALHSTAGLSPLVYVAELDLTESLGPLLDGPGRQYVDDLTAMSGVAQV